MKISAIMPTYNRGNLIENSIESIYRQEVVPDELIVVDDGSTDNTKEVVDKLRKRYKNIRYFYRNKKKWENPCVPLNIGIKKAKYELIVFCLSDIVHIGNTIKFMKYKHEQRDLQYIIGSTLYWMGKDVKVSKELWKTPEKITEIDCVVEWNHKLYTKDNQIVCQHDLYTSNIASCRREHLIKVGGFDEELTEFYGHEDSEITQRLLNMYVDKNTGLSKFKLIRDNSIKGIHQYHERPPKDMVAGSKIQANKVIKKIKDNQYYCEANVGKEWGKL